MKITKTWYRCPRCHLPVIDTDLPLEPGEVFPEVVTTEVIITPPYEGPQVDTEYPHNC